MGSSWKFVQSLIREATEDAAYEPVADVTLVYQKLRQIQRGAYTQTAAASGFLISSTIGDTSFSFTIPEGCSPKDLMEAAESALQLIAGKATVADIRAALLQRRKNTGADFSQLNCR